MKSNLAYQRTDRAIVQAFMRLVQKKEFEKITVQDILEEALVSRNTFYHHYCDKYALADTLYQELLGKFDTFFLQTYGQDLKTTVDFASRTQDTKKIPVPDAASPTSEARIQIMYQDFFIENHELIRTIMSIHTDSVNFDNVIMQHFENYYRNAAVNRHKSADTLKCEVTIYLGIISALSKLYLDGLAESARPVGHAPGVYQDGLTKPIGVKQGIQATLKPSVPISFNRMILDACLYTLGIRSTADYHKIYKYVTGFLPCERKDPT